MTTPTDPGNDSSFAPWYDEGMPIPVMHPIPWVYAEIYFSDVDKVEWRLYNYATDEYHVETFRQESEREKPISPAYHPEKETNTD